MPPILEAIVGTIGCELNKPHTACNHCGREAKRSPNTAHKRGCRLVKPIPRILPRLLRQVYNREELDALRRQNTYLKRLVLQANLGKLRDYDSDIDSVLQSPESSLPFDEESYEE